MTNAITIIGELDDVRLAELETLKAEAAPRAVYHVVVADDTLEEIVASSSVILFGDMRNLRQFTGVKKGSLLTFCALLDRDLVDPDGEPTIQLAGAGSAGGTIVEIVREIERKRLFSRPREIDVGLGEWMYDVRRFHLGCEQPAPESPARFLATRGQLRISLIEEETKETVEAFAERNLAKFADGIADVVFVTAGTAVEAGLFSQGDAVGSTVIDLLGDLGTDPKLANVDPFGPHATALLDKMVHESERTVSLIREILTADEPRYDVLRTRIYRLLEACDRLAHSAGLPFDGIWDAVRRANLSKVDPISGLVRRREDGKVLKPAGWTGPDAEIEDLVAGMLSFGS